MHDKKPALTLRNLTGAFIVLLFGFSLSFLVFLCEQLISLPNRHIRRLQEPRSNTKNFAKNTEVDAEVGNDGPERMRYKSFGQNQ